MACMACRVGMHTTGEWLMFTLSLPSSPRGCFLSNITRYLCRNTSQFSDFAPLMVVEKLLLGTRLTRTRLYFCFIIAH